MPGRNGAQEWGNKNHINQLVIGDGTPIRANTYQGESEELMPRFEGPIYLDKPEFTFSEAAFIAELSEPNIRTWATRGLLKPERHYTGRFLLTALDMLRLGVMKDLTEAVPLGPTVAAQAAELICRYVRGHSPHDENGPFLDLQAINPALVYAFAYSDLVYAFAYSDMVK